jgi:putative endonuclease
MRVKDAIGAWGEQVAADALTAAGMEVLARNWRCADGEIDIVARDGATLVVCEVKTRSSTRYGDPTEAVTPVKAARLRRLAMRWLADHPGGDAVRFDVVGIVRGIGREPARVDHRRGVID